MIKTIALWKMYITRSLTYVAIINAGMIMFLTIAKLKDYGLKISIQKWYIPIFLISILAMIIFGWIDDKIKLYEKEQKAVFDRNPQLQEIITRLRRIEEKNK